MEKSYVEMLPLWTSICPYCNHERKDTIGFDEIEKIVTCRKCGLKYIEIWSIGIN